MNLIDKNFISIRYVQRKLIDRICKRSAGEENLKLFNEIVEEWRNDRERSEKQD